MIAAFTAAPTYATVNAEFLPCSGRHTVVADTFDGPSSIAEVDLLDNQVIWFWFPFAVNGESVKVVKVGELPVEDPELEGRRRE